MAYDRYDTRHGSRGDRDRWSDDRFEGRGRSGERGFFERAGEEIASWFGGDDHDERESRERGYGRGDYRETGRERGGFAPQSARDQDWSHPDQTRMNRDRDDRREWFGGRSRQGDDYRGGERGWFRTDSYRPERDESLRRSERSRFGGGEYRGYRPVTGDYGRSGPPESNWDRDDYRRTSFAGSRDRSQHHDPHYHQWRERQLSELDRDYDEYHRERQSRFEDDFGSWRERRQQKRQLLGQVREHLEVVGSDGEHVGTVDKVAGDRIILTRSDPEAGGAHHSISCSQIDRIEDDRVILDTPAEQAKQRWRDDDRSRALFEREDQGEMGPGVLDRSFSGTYR